MIKLLHLADLHLGKNIYGISMLDNGDQDYYIDRLLEAVDEHKPDAVVIAGDVYDRSSPAGEAYALFNKLLRGFSDRKLPVMVIAGNHDSGLRLDYLSNYLEGQNVYISGSLTKELKAVVLKDKETGEDVTFWLMPYVYPDLVSNLYENDEVKLYSDAIKCVLDYQKIDFSKRNVLIAHQNVVDKNNEEVERGGSESSVGGVGRVACELFDGFEYVALGHIHSGYPVSDRIRYAGTPLCYHFDETKYPNKGCLFVSLNGLNNPIDTEKVIIPPLHNVRVVNDVFSNIMEKENDNSSNGEYIKVVIKDQRITPEITSKLHALFSSKNSYILELMSEYSPVAGISGDLSVDLRTNEDVESYFTRFYTSRNNGEQPDKEDEELFSLIGEAMRNNKIESVEDIKDGLINKLLDYVLEQEVSDETN